MATKRTKKTFDAVNMMRDIRDKISAETQNMSLDELKHYIQVKLNKSNSKSLLRK